MSLLSSIIPLFFHEGGVVGAGGTRRRAVHPAAFIAAPRFHNGGIPGLAPGEVPAILDGRPGREEEVITRSDPRHRYNGGGMPMQVTINTPDVNSFMRSRGQVEAELASMTQRGRRLL